MTIQKTLETKCMWRDSIDNNKTSFKGNYTVKCQKCDGYTPCFAYIPLELKDRVKTEKEVYHDKNNM